MEQQEQQQSLQLPGWLLGLGSLLVNKEIGLAMGQHPYELLEGLASFGNAKAAA